MIRKNYIVHKCKYSNTNNTKNVILQVVINERVTMALFKCLITFTLMHCVMITGCKQIKMVQSPSIKKLIKA